MAILNRGAVVATHATVSFEAGGWNATSAAVRDCWNGTDLGTFQNEISVDVQPHDTLVFVLSRV